MSLLAIGLRRNNGIRRNDIEGISRVSRLQSAGGGVAPRIPIVKTEVEPQLRRLAQTLYELERGGPAAGSLELTSGNHRPMSLIPNTDTNPAPVMTSPLE
jgi:hypothetical protein